MRSLEWVEMSLLVMGCSSDHAVGVTSVDWIVASHMEPFLVFLFVQSYCTIVVGSRVFSKEIFIMNGGCDSVSGMPSQYLPWPIRLVLEPNIFFHRSWHPYIYIPFRTHSLNIM